MIRVNQQVKTPLGVGFVQGGWEGEQYLVRVPISDENRQYLAQSLTPRATGSALWLFAGKELSA